MPRSLETIVRDLNALTAEEFDDRKPTACGTERLDEICDDVLNLPVPSAAFPEFFHLMERLSDSELGTPGSLVHTMERHVGAYEELLAASVSRKPTALTVWMVNRILNGERRDRDKWMEILTVAVDHPAASHDVRERARGFIAFQQKK
jgi:hypothetical protein